MELKADQISSSAGRPLPELTRRDIVVALLSVPSPDALESLPGIRRALLAAGNPMSAAFWEAAESVLGKIADGTATVGDVRGWLSATGTEPSGIIGLHVWDDEHERSPLQEEMHARLVAHLEAQLAAGAIDPDALLAGNQTAEREFREIQERWMTSPLADGRIPMDVLLDEQDEEYMAEWDAVDAEALQALEDVLRKAGERPMPAGELAAASARVRSAIAEQTWDGRMLAAFGGVTAAGLPGDDAELWLTLATGVAEPAGDPSEYLAEEDLAEEGALLDEEDGEFDSDNLDPISQAQASVMSLDHFDWLAVMSALVAGGPGSGASAADLAGYVRDFDPDEDSEGQDEDFLDEEDYDLEDLDDQLAIEGLFMHVTPLWQALGAIDENDRLTALGWWGLPEAMRRAWS